MRRVITRSTRLTPLGYGPNAVLDNRGAQTTIRPHSPGTMDTSTSGQSEIGPAVDHSISPHHRVWFIDAAEAESWHGQQRRSSIDDAFDERRDHFEFAWCGLDDVGRIVHVVAKLP